MTKNANKPAILASITLFLIILSVVPSNADSSSLPIVNTGMNVTLTVINDSDLHIDAVKFFTLNESALRKTYDSDDLSLVRVDVPLGFSFHSNMIKYIKNDSIETDSSIGILKIKSLNDCELIIEEPIYSLSVGELVFSRISCRMDGVLIHDQSIHLTRIPIFFGLSDLDNSFKEMNIKIILQYSTKICEDKQKYIYFIGYPLENIDQVVNFNVLSDDPLTLLFSKNQVGTNLSFIPYVDYYSIENPKIILDYDHEYDIRNERIEESLDIKNNYNQSLFYVTFEEDGQQHYKIIGLDDDSNYEKPYDLQPTKGYVTLHTGKEIPLDFSKKSCAVFGWNKILFPFECYEIDDSRIMTVDFETNQPLSFFVKYDLDINKMDLFEINQEESYYCISPTKCETPLVININNTAFYQPRILDVSKAGFVCQNSGQFLMMTYDDIRYYSTVFNAEKKSVIDSSGDSYSFNESNFVINIPHNEITINYHLKYSTKSIYKFYFAILMVWIVFTGYITMKVEKYKGLSFIAGTTGYLYTLLQIHPEGYPLMTLFNIIPVLLVLSLILLHFRSKVRKILLHVTSYLWSIRKCLKRNPKR